MADSNFGVGYVQRWRNRRTQYRPAREVINPRHFEIAEVRFGGAKQFIETHHYSRSMPSTRFTFGLFRNYQLVGTAVFSHPCNDRTLSAVFPCEPLAAIELGRFVLLDEVEANAESFFLARCLKHLRRFGLEGVVAFSDPVPRRSNDGVLVKPGHCGIAYQATGGLYLGRGTPRTVRVLPDGTIFNDRAIQKVRSQETGWRYAARRLEAFGADPLTSGDPRRWLACWLPRITTALRHGGNHKYAWPLDRAMRKQLGNSLPFPKRPDPLHYQLTFPSCQDSAL